MSTPLDYFKLQSDASERDVKRAYAKKLRSIRPDDDPVGFQQLHAMYQQALAWARRNLQLNPMPTAQSAIPDRPTAPVPANVPHHAPTAAVTPAPTATFAPVPPDASPAPFNPLGFLHALSQRITELDADTLQDWLKQQPELWSLDNKRIAGQFLLSQLFQDPQPIAAANFDVVLQFFGFDQVASGADPARLRWLRTEMAEQHQALLQARQHAALGAPGYVSPDGRLISPWGSGHAQSDPDRFFDWLCIEAPGLRLEELTTHIRVGLLQLPRPVKGRCARQVVERLLQDQPALPANCTNLVLQLLLPYAGNVAAQPALRELPARLQIKWLLLPGNTISLHAKTQPQGRSRSHWITSYLLRCARLPFAWWRILLLCLLPGWPTAMGGFLRRLSDDQPTRLNETFDADTVDFWITATARQRLSIPRMAVGAVRCAVLLLFGGLVGLCSKLLSGTNPWGMLLLALLVSGAWLAYLIYILTYLWQRTPEAPPKPYAWARFLFIPAMIALGLAIYFASGNIVATQVVLVPLTLLAFQRYQARSQTPIRLTSFSGRFRLLSFYLGLALLTQILALPPLSACTALLLWGIDAYPRDHRPSLKRDGKTKRQTTSQPSRGQ